MIHRHHEPVEQRILEEDRQRDLSILECLRRDACFTITHPLTTYRFVKAHNTPFPTTDED